MCTPFISKERDQSYSACHLIDSNTALTEMTDSNRFVLLKEKMEIEQFENLPIIMQKEIILKKTSGKFSFYLGEQNTRY